MAAVAVIHATLPCLLCQTLDPEGEGSGYASVRVGEATYPAQLLTVSIDEAQWLDAVIAEFQAVQVFLRERT